MFPRLLLAFALAASTFAAARFDASFPGGSLGKVESLSPTHFRVAVIGEKDNEGRNRQASWFYFHLTGAASGPLTIDLIDLPGEYNYQANKGPIDNQTPPFFSYDNEHWQPATNIDYDANEPRLRLHLNAPNGELWVARLTPYTSTHLERLRVDLLKSSIAKEEIIGRSIENRPLYLWTITAPGPLTNRKVIWLFFRQHSWETGSSWTGEGAIRSLLSTPALTRDTIWKIVPASDPDGLFHGGVRFNRRGYDLNRNWDVDNPAAMPEITAERNAIDAWRKAGHPIDLLFSLHNTETSEYLEGPPAPAKFQELAGRFFQLLKDHTTFSPTRPLFFGEASTAKDRSGRMTITQGCYARFGIPGFLMEQRIAKHAKLDRFATTADRLQFGRELVLAAWAAVQNSRYPLE